MANLTVTVNDQVLKRARIKAIERGTSVNAVVSEYLERYAGAAQTAEALRRFAELAEQVSGSSGPDGRTWRREDLYDRPVLRHRR
ncbi:MAG TPA: hypothetical protein VIM30_06340 [Candidatus Limnocylindrales bacterium]|jgi:hypothetical protein